MSIARRTARVLGVLAAVAQSAHAQTSPTVADTTTVDRDILLQQVTVTATRVERSGYSAPTPTTVVSADDIQNTGATDIAQFLNQNVPGFYGTWNPTSSTLSSNQAGMNFLDLRSLGAQRTLILVDGQRFVPTTQDGKVDLNVIPQSAVERVEVVTGGASAQWGSDAVSGVVNIITNNNLVGFKGNVEGGISEYGDERTAHASLAFGDKFADGRGHFMLALEGFNNSGISSQSDRPWSAGGWQVIANPNYSPGNGQPQELVASNVHLSIATEGGLILGGPLNNTQFLPGGIPAAFRTGTAVGSLSMIGGDGVNMGSYTALDTPVTRDSAFARISYQFSDAVTASLRASFANTTSSLNVVQPFDLGDLTIQADNAFLPASIRNVMTAQNLSNFTFGRVDTDFGFYHARTADNVVRVVGDIKADLGGSWGLDTYFEYGRTRFRSSQLSVLTSNYANSVDAVLNPANGQIVCRSTLTNPTDGCVPINLFGAGSPSQAALDYIHDVQETWTTLEENAAATTLHGEPFSTWAGPVSVAAGLEYRRELANTVVDPLTLAGDFNLGNTVPSGGSFNVKEGFAETVLPLAKDAFLAKSMNLDGAVRETDYSTSGRVTTWKAGLNYEPLAGITLRASRSRDIRAPSIEELFIPAGSYYDTVTDPRTGGQVTIPINTHGNKDLAAEKSDTTTLGLVFQPAWLSGLRASVDYYDIAISGAISTLADQDVVNRCEDGNTSLCQYVNRNSAGQITSIDLVNINLATLKTRGYDISADYSFRADSLLKTLPGTFGVRFLGTYVQSFVQDDGVTRDDTAGDVGNNLTSIPHMKWTASLTYQNAGWSSYLGGRFVGGGWIDHTLGSDGINNNHVDHQFLVDLTLSRSLIDTDDRLVQVYATVNNVFNTAAPIDPSTFFVPRASNPALYDSFGRLYKIGVRVRL